MEKQQPGFVLPPSAPTPQYPGYPNQQQPQPYPQQPQAYPQQPPQPYYPNQQPFPAPIQQQPIPYGQPSLWFNTNFSTFLKNATSFHVKQKVELLEALVGWETGNQYTVQDQAGNKVFYVGEDSNMCGRQLCNARRPFTLTVKDTTGQNVIIMDRSLDCSCLCGALFPDKLQVTTPAGQLLGTVCEEFNILYPKFKIKDALNNTVLKLEGPLCPMTLGSCGGPVVFRLMNTAGISVGTISKEWGGLVRELFTDADHFSISFPYDLDPAIKAVCIGALFLIDYEYYEAGPTDNQQGGRRLFA